MDSVTRIVTMQRNGLNVAAIAAILDVEEAEVLTLLRDQSAFNEMVGTTFTPGTPQEAERAFNDPFSPGSEDADDHRAGTFVSYTVGVYATPGDTRYVSLRSNGAGNRVLARFGLDRGGETPGSEEGITIEGTLSAVVRDGESMTIVAGGVVDENVWFIDQTEIAL